MIAPIFGFFLTHPTAGYSTCAILRQRQSRQRGAGDHVSLRLRVPAGDRRRRWLGQRQRPRERALDVLDRERAAAQQIGGQTRRRLGVGSQQNVLQQERVRVTRGARVGAAVQVRVNRFGLAVVVCDWMECTNTSIRGVVWEIRK
jgi:hypothetical protein